MALKQHKNAKNHRSKTRIRPEIAKNGLKTAQNIKISGFIRLRGFAKLQASFYLIWPILDDGNRWFYTKDMGPSQVSCHWSARGPMVQHYVLDRVQGCLPYCFRGRGSIMEGRKTTTILRPFLAWRVSLREIMTDNAFMLSSWIKLETSLLFPGLSEWHGL